LIAASSTIWDLLLTAGALGLIVVANLAVQRPLLRVLVLVVFSVFGLITVMIGLALLATAASLGHRLGIESGQVLRAGVGLLVTGGADLLVLAPPLRRGLARLMPFDPDNPVHLTALALTTMLVGFQFTLQISTDVLAETARGDPLQWWDLLLQEIPFLLAGVLGVGFLVRRRFRGTLDRLGVVTPRVWQVALGLAAAGVMTWLSVGSDALARTLTPDLARRVDESSNRLFGQVGDPFGVAVLAVSAGVCEEVLFRGAIQPRLGLVWTSIVFAALHTQYGLSVATLTVLVLGAGMGLLRKYVNTTTSMICHVVYDALAGLPILGLWIWVGVAAEASLLVYLVFAFRRARLLAARF
jgi:membrane protease YdiL (CAAX protease family)